jgi:amidohydrolase
MSELQTLKERITAAIDTQRDDLIRIADRIHTRPEAAFEETESAALLSDTLEEHGFQVERGVAGLDTAFVATIHGQKGGPTLAILAEYDALPGLGHACGHNLIGTAALGAGLAMQEVLSELEGTIQVIGTPGEEGGGGKGILVDAGVFQGVDAAMMVHPWGKNLIRRPLLTSYKILIEFYGKPAHAAAEPEEGINALEAMILTYSAVSAQRQHLRGDARIHGVITHGGDAPNIVPEYTQAKFYVRAKDTPYAAVVVEKLRACAEGAARATGARLAFREYAPRYDNLLVTPKFSELAEANMAALGIELSLPDDRMCSSDMGNVSQVVPSIHPYISIGPEDMGVHTAEFCAAAGSPAGHEGMIKAAKIMAMTAVDLLAEPANLLDVQQSFEGEKALQGG